MSKNPNTRSYWVSRRIWRAYLRSGINGAQFNWRVDSHRSRFTVRDSADSAAVAPKGKK